MAICTQDYSDWRALHHTHAPFGHQLAAARAIEHEELRQVALRETWRGLNVEQVAREATWQGSSTAEYGGNVFTQSLTSYDEKYWRITHAGCVIADQNTVDLVRVAHRWSTVPAREVLPLWEEWARVHSPEHLDAPRLAIEAKEAWCRGEISDAELNSARSAAAAEAAWAWAAWASSAAAAASAAAWAAWEASATAAWATSEAAAWAEAKEGAMSAHQLAFTAYAIEAVREIKYKEAI